MKLIKSRLPLSRSQPGHEAEVKRMLHDLLHKSIKSGGGGLKKEPTVEVIGELLIKSPELASVVVDIFVLVDLETSSSSSGKNENRDRFIALLKEAEKFLPEETLKERMVVDTLGEAGILTNAKKFFNSIIKQKTKLFYKQQKYNLLREESEGYAKLITELSNPDFNPEELIQRIKSIIGFFNLDPNRVLDIILEAFEIQEADSLFVELIRLYTPDSNTLKELLGFKVKFYSPEIPESLFKQLATLVRSGIVQLDPVYSMLSPDDKLIRSAAEKELQSAREFLRKAGIVSTNKGEEAELTVNDLMAKRAEGAEKSGSRNQKFGFLKALLDVGAWSEAEEILNRLPCYQAVAVPSIAQSLQNLIHRTMASTEEVDESIERMLLTLGPFAHDDGILLYKVLRRLRKHLIHEDSNKINERGGEMYHRALTLMDEVFLPALSMSESNCCLAEEIWSLLKAFPYDCRYRLYGEWKSQTFATHPVLTKKRAVLQKQIKRLMQRISKENVKQTSRQLGKLTHSAPGLLFDYILSQIQLYDNLIGPVVDSFKYVTSLSLDVLAYSIIEALNNPEKDRTKHDGTSISLWLQSLSNFCGAVFKKYNIELTGILQYVANQLKSKKSLDLLILKEVVLKMGGIEAAEEMTLEQIRAMSGGELLRSEAGSFTQIKNTRKSSQRLKDALIDNNLAVPLCLLMAQQRNCVVYMETENSHLKLVGKLFDQCQDTLVQFGTFLASNLSIDDYNRRLPEMKELLSSYHVNLDLAFFLARPNFNHKISQKFEDLLRRSEVVQGEKGEDRKRRIYVDASLAIMQPVTEAIRPLHPDKIWDDISPQFLTTFWSLTMYDLCVPDEVYEKELAKLKSLPAKVDENRDLNASRKKREKERLNSMIEKMSDEQRKQKKHVEMVMARLKEETDSWFFTRSRKNETITSFLQLCLFPRCIFTASDAVFCAKFVHIVHSLKTPNFSTLICFDRIFCDITYTVTSCSENEAHRYGRFLQAMLDIMLRWWRSKEVFDKECTGYPGFMTKCKTSTAAEKVQAMEAASSSPGAIADGVDFENYRHLCHKWHYKIAKGLVLCLESKDYVQIRNALTILIKILPTYPVMANLAGVIEKRIDKVCVEEKEKRPDLYVMATSYMGQLKVKKPGMIKESEFHQAKDKKSENGNGTANSNAAAESAASRRRSQSSEKDRKSQSRERSLPLGGSSGQKRRSSSKEKMGPPSSTSSSRGRSVDPGDDRGNEVNYNGVLH